MLLKSDALSVYFKCLHMMTVCNDYVSAKLDGWFDFGSGMKELGNGSATIFPLGELVYSCDTK